MAVVRKMVCCDCGGKMDATVPKAKRAGWELWLGGARCKACREKSGVHVDPPLRRREEIVIECSECSRVIRGGVEYEDGFRPTFHWLVTPDNKRRLREERVPIPLCPGMKRAGRVVESPPESSP